MSRAFVFMKDNTRMVRIPVRVKDYIVVLEYLERVKKPDIVYSTVRIQRFKGTVEEMAKINKWEGTIEEVQVPSNIDPLVTMLFAAACEAANVMLGH